MSVPTDKMQILVIRNDKLIYKSSNYNERIGGVIKKIAPSSDCFLYYNSPLHFIILKLTESCL